MQCMSAWSSYWPEHRCASDSWCGNRQVSVHKSKPQRRCVQLLWLISSLVVSGSSSPGSSEVSHFGIQMSQMNARTRSGKQWGATGGLGPASESNREASMYVCMPTACPYDAFSCVPLMDIESSLQGVSSETGTLLSQFDVFSQGTKTVDSVSFAMCFIAAISYLWLHLQKRAPLCFSLV